MSAGYPRLGTCWACIEYADDWTEKPVVAYCMAGDMCGTHKDDDGCEQITDPYTINAVKAIGGLDGHQN